MTRATGDIKSAGSDPIAEKLREARTKEERARILAPCVAQVIDEQGLQVEVAYPRNPDGFDTGIHDIVKSRSSGN